jgi:hypothetical protein
MGNLLGPHGAGHHGWASGPLKRKCGETLAGGSPLPGPELRRWSGRGKVAGRSCGVRAWRCGPTARLSRGVGYAWPLGHGATDTDWHG